MNHDLIKQLQALNPTEGDWKIDGADLRINKKFVATVLYATEDDSKLITLAPTMRTEILAMAKEIEELREENRKLKDYINPPKKDSFFDGFKVGQRD